MSIITVLGNKLDSTLIMLVAEIGARDQMQKDWGLRDSQDGTVYFNLLKTQSRTSGRTVIWNSYGHRKNTADRELDD